MGQFEITGNKRKDLIPDIIILNVHSYVENKNVVDSDDIINKAKESLKEKVVSLSSNLEDLSKDCNISFSNLSYLKIPVKGVSEALNQGFGIGKKKQDNLVTVKAVVNITIKLTTRDENILIDVLKLLLNSVEVISITDNIEVSDLEDKYNELKADVCRKCRSDADVIVKNLGSKIIGVEKVVYNSSGSLLDNNKKDFKYSSKRIKPTSLDSFSDFGDFGESCDESFDSLPDDLVVEKYDDTWARGFVKCILDRKFVIDDSVQVLFNIE